MKPVRGVSKKVHKTIFRNFVRCYSYMKPLFLVGEEITDQNDSNRTK